MRILSVALVLGVLSAGGTTAAEGEDRPGVEYIFPSFTITTEGISRDFRIARRDFERFDRAQIARLALRTDESRRVRIEGFSPEMSEQLVAMAFVARAQTQDLLRDMAGLDGEEARRARLDRAASAATASPGFAEGVAFWKSRPAEGRL